MEAQRPLSPRPSTKSLENPPKTFQSDSIYILYSPSGEQQVPIDGDADRSARIITMDQFSKKYELHPAATQRKSPTANYLLDPKPLDIQSSESLREGLMDLTQGNTLPVDYMPKGWTANPTIIGHAKGSVPLRYEPSTELGAKERLDKYMNRGRRDETKQLYRGYLVDRKAQAMSSVRPFYEAQALAASQEAARPRIITAAEILLSLGEHQTAEASRASGTSSGLPEEEWPFNQTNVEALLDGAVPALGSVPSATSLTLSGDEQPQPEPGVTSKEEVDSGPASSTEVKKPAAKKSKKKKGKGKRKTKIKSKPPGKSQRLPETKPGLQTSEGASSDSGSETLSEAGIIKTMQAKESGRNMSPPDLNGMSPEDKLATRSPEQNATKPTTPGEIEQPEIKVESKTDQDSISISKRDPLANGAKPETKAASNAPDVTDERPRPAIKTSLIPNGKPTELPPTQLGHDDFGSFATNREKKHAKVKVVALSDKTTPTDKTDSTLSKVLSKPKGSEIFVRVPPSQPQAPPRQPPPEQEWETWVDPDEGWTLATRGKPAARKPPANDARPPATLENLPPAQQSQGKPAYPAVAPDRRMRPSPPSKQVQKSVTKHESTRPAQQGRELQTRASTTPTSKLNPQTVGRDPVSKGKENGALTDTANSSPRQSEAAPNTGVGSEVGTPSVDKVDTDQKRTASYASMTARPVAQPPPRVVTPPPPPGLLSSWGIPSPRKSSNAQVDGNPDLDPFPPLGTQVNGKPVSPAIPPPNGLLASTATPDPSEPPKTQVNGKQSSKDQVAGNPDLDPFPPLGTQVNGKPASAAHPPPNGLLSSTATPDPSEPPKTQIVSQPAPPSAPSELHETQVADKKPHEPQLAGEPVLTSDPAPSTPVTGEPVSSSVPPTNGQLFNKATSGSSKPPTAQVAGNPPLTAVPLPKTRVAGIPASTSLPKKPPKSRFAGKPGRGQRPRKATTGSGKPPKPQVADKAVQALVPPPRAPEKHTPAAVPSLPDSNGTSPCGKQPQQAPQLGEAPLDAQDVDHDNANQQDHSSDSDFTMRRTSPGGSSIVTVVPFDKPPVFVDPWRQYEIDCGVDIGDELCLKTLRSEFPYNRRKSLPPSFELHRFYTKDQRDFLVREGLYPHQDEADKLAEREKHRRLRAFKTRARRVSEPKWMYSRDSEAWEYLEYERAVAIEAGADVNDYGGWDPKDSA